MGTKDYLPGQIYSLTDYTQQQPVQDTAMLRGRRPWYSEEYRDDIVYTHTEPWQATHGGIFSAAERIGEKQYELSNHTSTSLSTGLGNVMATISDNKYGVYGGKGNLNLEGWHPAIRAVYDYYPFCPDSYRELMPDRYVSDTSRHCVTLTQPHWVWKWTVIGCKDYYEWIWPKLTLMGAATAAPTDNGILLNAQHPGDGMSFELNALPNTENQLQLELNGLDMSKNAALQILEQNSEEGWTVLAEVPIKDGEGLTVPFYPSLGKVKVVLLGPIRVFIRRVCAEGMAWVEEDQLVTICDGDGDKYRFGFGTMEKDNEIAGIGNSYTTHFRQYDPRLGRWMSPDPEMSKYPGWSPYVYTFDNPIAFNDPNGDDPPYKIQNGVMIGAGVVNDITKETERPKMKVITAVVLHRTVSNSAASAIRTTKSSGGTTGFHIVVDKDGTITQVNNFENRANHVGKQKGDVGNFNSIGIEVVGNYNEKTKSWDPLTNEQIENTAQAVNTILKEYNLKPADIYPHEDVSWKTAGEGKTVMDAIQGRLTELYNGGGEKEAEKKTTNSNFVIPAQQTVSPVDDTYVKPPVVLPQSTNSNGN